MKTFTFENINKASIIKGLIIAAVYLGTVFGICYIIFGGITGMADKVNNFGSAKAAGLIIGVIVLLPFFIILQFIHPKITVEIDSEKIINKMKGKPDEIIQLSSIDKMELNVRKINKLDIYDDKGNLITYFNPAKHPTVLEQIISEIVSHKEYEKKSKTENYFGKSLERTTYKRK
jgi:hypothetical protein